MPDPKFIYHFEIVNHAHCIPCSVSLIQLFQPGTGKTITTFRTIFDFSFGDLFAIFDSTPIPVF
jgi:hypothetical protein